MLQFQSIIDLTAFPQRVPCSVSQKIPIFVEKLNPAHYLVAFPSFSFFSLALSAIRLNLQNAKKSLAILASYF
jgi:hypothetical protein